MQIVPFARKKRVLFDVKNDVEIACGTAEHTGLAISSEANAGAVFDSRGDLGVHRALPQYAALALALRARISNNAAHSLARGSGARHREEALLITDLASSLAGTAGDRSFAGCGAGARTFFAGFVTADVDLGLGTEDRFFEFEGEVLPQVGAALRARTSSSAAGGTE